MPSDFGPSVTLQRDGRLISRGPARVILEDREDLDREPNRSGQRPVVRGARRHTVILEMYGRGAITKTMLAAATRFVDDLALAAGASSRDPVPSVPMAAWQRTPHQRQLDATSRVRRIMSALRITPEVPFWWVVVLDRPLRDYRGVRYDKAHGWLVSDLEALDRSYNPPARRA